MTHQNDSTTPTDEIARRKLIAAQNDQFRREGYRSSIPGQHVITQGIEALRLDRKIDILIRVRDFNRFDDANDPYGEHDFGAFDVEDVGKIFWKIDLYDVDYRYGSEDPTDLTQTRRVLTVMLAEEY